MVVRRRKKSRKYRGSRYMRRGYNDRNRGAGNRGGRGKSGWKFGKQKLKKLLEEYPEIFERKRGFKPVNMRETKVINVSDLESLIPRFLKEGIAEIKEDTLYIDLTKAGIDKLLGEGNIYTKVHVVVPKASKSAIEKIESAGGIVELKAF